MPRRYSYPENLLSALRLNEETQRQIRYDELTDDQRKGLEYALSALTEREQVVLRRRFCDGLSCKTIALRYNLSENRAKCIVQDALRWLRKNAVWLYYITDGYEARTADLQKQLQTEERMYCERFEITSPMHLYYDAFIHPESCTNIRATAKELKVPEKLFTAFLIRKRYLYRAPSGGLMPYAKAADDGLFFVKDYIAVNGHQGVYTLVTPKGKALFLSMLGEIA